MLRIMFLLLAINAGVCSAQETFIIGEYQVTDRDPMRDIIHVENIGVYPVPAGEMTISPGAGMVRWNETKSWLGSDLTRRNEMTILYQNPKDGKWYVVAKGFVAGYGVRFWTKWEGKYLVELKNPDHPIVLEVERLGDQIKAQANVVYD